MLATRSIYVRSRLALPPRAFFATAMASAQRLPPDIQPNPSSAAATSTTSDDTVTLPSATDSQASQEERKSSFSSSSSSSSSSTRVALFVLLAAFLRAWQPEVLARDPTTGCSPLSEQVPTDFLFAQDSKNGSPPLLTGASAVRVRHLLALEKVLITD